MCLYYLAQGQHDNLLKLGRHTEAYIFKFADAMKLINCAIEPKNRDVNTFIKRAWKQLVALGKILPLATAPLHP